MTDLLAITVEKCSFPGEKNRKLALNYQVLFLTQELRKVMKLNKKYNTNILKILSLLPNIGYYDQNNSPNGEDMRDSIECVNRKLLTLT